MIRFAIASLSPVALLAAAILWGGAWSGAALAHATVAVLALDHWLAPPQVHQDGTEDAREIAAGRCLGIAIGLLHFPLLAAGLWSIAAGPATGLSAVLLAVALGLYFGQVGNSNAHELIHSGSRRVRRLGVAVYVSLLFGHHASAHPLVHHVWAATDRDPNSAPRGMGFYRYWLRAWGGSFRAGFEAETARLRRAPDARLHPYAVYVGGGAALCLLVWATLGWTGLAAYLAIALYAQTQLLLSDYVQHYGLRRARRADGTPEPMALRHSWNAPHWYSSAMMLNAPRHSDHHMNPGRPFPELRIVPNVMPVLPRSLPVMAALALFPPFWRRVMDRRAARWSEVGAGGPDLAQSVHAQNACDSPLADPRCAGRAEPAER